VPTQTIDSSVWRTASAGSVTARSRPALTPSSISSARPGSTIGERASLISPTLVSLGSTPITWWPSAAKHAADTLPT
jgi:hypothetical protein